MSQSLKITKYIQPLTDVDRICVRMVRSGRNIVDFSVQYEALINNYWCAITRYDTAHGYPHRHVFRPERKDYRHPLSVRDKNDAYTEAVTMIKKNFSTMRESYILVTRPESGQKI